MTGAAGPDGATGAGGAGGVEPTGAAGAESGGVIGAESDEVAGTEPTGVVAADGGAFAESDDDAVGAESDEVGGVESAGAMGAELYEMVGPESDRAAGAESADGGAWRLVGDDALLVDLPDGDAVARLAAALRAAPPEGVLDVVPAARTVLVRGTPWARYRWAREVQRVAAGSSPPVPTGAPAPRVVEIPVTYDGEDLAAVARLVGLSADEVVARHAGATYRVAFGGFMPGFAYLTGLDPALRVPRLDTPRTRVPAGAVAIAGEYAAVYPRATPGGWRLLGRTDAVMFDASHDERPALVVPGDEVRFAPVRPAVRATTGPSPDTPTLPTPPASPTPPTPLAPPKQPEPAPPKEGGLGPTEVGTSTRDVHPRVHHSRESAQLAARPITGTGTNCAPKGGIEVIATGPLVLVEDLGRAGLAAVGVPRSGAADPAALREANRLVGNAPGAAALEVVLGGLVVRFGTTGAIALTGAHAPADLGGEPVPYGRAVRAPAGATLTLGPPGSGLRTWLAVRGGIDVPAVLGSRSSDVLSGLGPPPVAPGHTLPLGRAYQGLPDPGPSQGFAGPGTVADGGGSGSRSRPSRAGQAGAEEVPAPDGVAAAEGGGSAEPPATGSTESLATASVELPAAASVEPPATGSAEPPATEPAELPVTAGPRADWITERAWRRLGEQVWTVGSASNRVALRLEGEPLERAREGELPSEGLVAGAVQVPHDGRPVVFGPDHPVTGGYPVVAVLTPEGVAAAAQCRPGDRVRFVVRGPRDEVHPEVGT